MKKALVFFLTLALVFAIGTTAYATNDTPVKLMVSETQISVTVPLEIVATVDWETGELEFPNAASTLITNNSVFPIKVASIACSVETGWALAATGGSVDDTIVATITPNATDTSSVALLGASQNASGSAWNMARADAVGTGDSIELTLAGAIENADDMTANLGADAEAAATAFTITFTVAAGANQDA